MSMHQFVPKFANEYKCNDCHEDKSIHNSLSIIEILENLVYDTDNSYGFPPDYEPDYKKASQAIERLITEGYKKGYIDGSIEQLNGATV